MEEITTPHNQLDALKTEAKKAAQLVKKELEDRRVPILRARLTMGRYQHELRKQMPSTKLYGIQLAQDIPETQDMDDALRSNQKWLYEALYVPGSEGNDIRDILGIENLADFHSDSATVIKRKYKKHKAQMIADGDLTPARHHPAFSVERTASDEGEEHQEVARPRKPAPRPKR